MTPADLKKAVQDILPQLIAEDPQVRDFVLRTVSRYYDSREETETRFDRVLAELQRDREEQSRKWDEQSQKWDEQRQQTQAMLADLRQLREEQSQKWDEQSQKWDEQRQQTQAMLADLRQLREEQSRRWDEQHQQTQEILAGIKQQERRYESSIGAIGSRWGLYSEESFRSALKGILEESFRVQVLNVNDFDEAGEVFGRPDQVELDIVITNGSVIACEIKSSLSKSDMYSFDRKVAFYQKRHERPVVRKLVISPMVDQRALPVAEALGIEVYSSPQSMPGYRYGAARDNVL